LAAADALKREAISLMDEAQDTAADITRLRGAADADISAAMQETARLQEFIALAENSVASMVRIS
jgi:hypothetical protein